VGNCVWICFSFFFIGLLFVFWLRLRVLANVLSWPHDMLFSPHKTLLGLPYVSYRRPRPYVDKTRQQRICVMWCRSIYTAFRSSRAGIPHFKQAKLEGHCPQPLVHSILCKNVGLLQRHVLISNGNSRPWTLVRIAFLAHWMSYVNSIQEASVNVVNVFGLSDTYIRAKIIFVLRLRPHRTSLYHDVLQTLWSPSGIPSPCALLLLPSTNPLSSVLHSDNFISMSTLQSPEY